jgi:GntR family transcriptional regulator / MocR family aminotransferase
MWHCLFPGSSAGAVNLQDQIRQMLVSAILDGHFPLGMPIPSGRKLADELGVARNTVVLAYQQLVGEGYLVARERSGYYVDPEILGARVPFAAHSGRPQARASDWLKRLRFRPSQQRNIVKPSDWQTFPHPFIYGQFDPSLFPTQDWRECCMKQLSVMEVRDWAPDLMSRDDASLVQQIRSRVLPRRGVWATADEILVTIGAQHALYSLADLLVSARTTVGIEDPGYPDARNIFSLRTRRLVALPLDAEGLALAKSLRACDYVYVTPSHQCPTTVTMSLGRRKALLALAAEHDFMLIEDDYELETGFGGAPTPALKSLDERGHVIYVGSLSKAFAPGLRVGYIVGPKEVICELRALRRLMVRHPSAFIQRSFSLFLALGYYDALQRRLSAAYQERMRVLQAALAKHLPEASFVPAAGGASCWVSGPRGLDARVLAAAAAERGVLIEPGDVFFKSEKPSGRHFRLGITSIAAERIEKGILELAETLRILAQSAGDNWPYAGQGAGVSLGRDPSFNVEEES